MDPCLVLSETGQSRGSDVVGLQVHSLHPSKLTLAEAVGGGGLLVRNACKWHGNAELNPSVFSRGVAPRPNVC
jgi:hypothetical protein